MSDIGDAVRTKIVNSANELFINQPKAQDVLGGTDENLGYAWVEVHDAGAKNQDMKGSFYAVAEGVGRFTEGNYTRKDGANISSDIKINNYKIMKLADGVDKNDAVNKGQLDKAIQTMAVKRTFTSSDSSEIEIQANNPVAIKIYNASGVDVTSSKTITFTSTNITISGLTSGDNGYYIE